MHVTAAAPCGRRSRAPGRVLLVALATAVGVVASAHAQKPRDADASPFTRTPAAPTDAADATIQLDTTPRLVSGRIVRPTADTVLPVPGIWVTIHRVGSDTAAPMDSMRTRRDGTFTFRYRPFGDPKAVYFVSASYGGIAYFSEPLTSPRVTGTDAEITVFDTTSAPVPLTVRGRHIIVASPRADGTREMMEVFELSNDTTVTRVAPDDAHPTWTAILPPGITDFRPGQMDISPQTVRMADGEIAVVAPFAPGIKQLSFSFRAPAKDFPLSIPVEKGATVLEVLVEEPSAQVSGAGLQQVTAVSVQGQVFSRYLAQDVPANSVVRITVPAVTPARNPYYVVGIAIAIGVAMLVALTMALKRRAARQTVPVGPAIASDAENPELIARAIAQLDGSFERRVSPTPEDRAAYTRTRDALKQRLVAALAAQRRTG